MKRLREDEIAKMMREVQGWTRAGDSIERTWRFKTFMEAVAFMNQVFALANDADHHPDLKNIRTTVTIRLSTHDADGLTK